MKYSLVGVESIHPPEHNPRTIRDDVKLQELAESIKVHGILQPLMVTPFANEWTLVAGSRRLAAAKIAGLTEAPVVILEGDGARGAVSDFTQAEVAIIENLQRENLTPMEEAFGYQKMVAEMYYPVNEVARKLGVSVGRVRRSLRLVTLPEKIRDALAKGEINVGHADILVRVPAEMLDEAMDRSRVAALPFGGGQVDCEFEPAPLSVLASWARKNLVSDVEDRTIVEDYLPGVAEKVENAERLPTLLKLSESTRATADLGNKDHGLLGSGSWVEIGSTPIGASRPIPACENSQEGIVLHGGPTRVIVVCAKKGCTMHRPTKAERERQEKVAGEPSDDKPPETDEEREKREKFVKAEKKRLENLAVWRGQRSDVIANFLDHVAEVKLTPELLEAATGLTKGVKGVLGNEWELTESNMAQALIWGMIPSSYYADDPDDRRRVQKFCKQFGYTLPPLTGGRKSATKGKRQPKPDPKPKNVEKVDNEERPPF